MGLEFTHGPLAKQRGGKFSVKTYLLIALLAIASFEAVLIRHQYERLQEATETLPLWEVELYQLTPQDWNDEAYTVQMVPADADSCNSYQQPVCYTII